MENDTKDDRFKRALGQANSLPPDIAVFLASLNIFLAISATLLNALILVSLIRGYTLQKPRVLLFRCSAITDVSVGIITQPLFATYLLNAVAKINLRLLYYVVELANVSGFILCGVSISTWTTISVDRLLILLFDTSYKHIMTVKRVRVLIRCFWLTGISGGFAYTFWNHRITYRAGIVYSLLCITLSVFSYTKIFLELRKHHFQVQDLTHQVQHSSNGSALNVERYKKTVYSIVSLQLVLLICYVPFYTSSVLIEMNRWRRLSADIIWFASLTLVYLNSTLNPILYYFMIRKVRLAVRRTVEHYWC